MANIESFERLSEQYDAWFEKHREIYMYEVEALKKLMPKFQKGIEIGVGTGRFALPLDIKTGLEPSAKMAAYAKKRGIEVITAEAEAIPLPDESYDLVLMVTTICFVEDVKKSIQEIWRILKPEGDVIVGFIDKDSPLGSLYQKNRQKSHFYKTAHFFSAHEVEKLLESRGFSDCKAVQTLFGKDLDHMRGGVMPGYGEGAFVVIRCKKRTE